MNRLEFRVRNKKTKELVCCHQNGLNFTLDTGQLYSGGMNVTDNYWIEQYTNLKDKNGVKIFEGDIVSQFGNPEPMIVEWYRLAFRFDKIFHMCEIHSNGLEIIGNIHQNPELLETEL